MIPLAKVRRVMNEKLVDLEKQFKEREQKIQDGKFGHVTLIQFQYILNQELELEQDEIDLLTTFLME